MEYILQRKTDYINYCLRKKLIIPENLILEDKIHHTNNFWNYNILLDNLLRYKKEYIRLGGSHIIKVKDRNNWNKNSFYCVNRIGNVILL